jgi:peroxiredoxin Q/BCP
VDLEDSPQFASLNITLVSVATDPVRELSKAAVEWRTRAPLLSDAGGLVSRSYGVLRWAMASGEPGHTFVLVGRDGKVRWVRDYGAPENGGLMYVAVDRLLRDMAPVISPRP